MRATTKLHPDYRSLVQRFPLRPIRTERSHNRAMKLVRELAPAGEGTLSAGQQDYYDALAVLLEDYDRQHDSLSQLSGLDVLRSLLEARDIPNVIPNVRKERTARTEGHLWREWPCNSRIKGPLTYDRPRIAELTMLTSLAG